MAGTWFDGHRSTCVLTDTEAGGIAGLELRHRRRTRVEDSIRAGKDAGMRNLLVHDFADNEVWLELSLIAQDLLCWAKALVLDGSLALAEPKRLCQRLLHVAGRIARSGRRRILRLPRSWALGWGDRGGVRSIAGAAAYCVELTLDWFLRSSSIASDHPASAGGSALGGSRPFQIGEAGKGRDLG
jgi:hypothetical protein